MNSALLVLILFVSAVYGFQSSSSKVLLSNSRFVALKKRIAMSLSDSSNKNAKSWIASAILPLAFFADPSIMTTHNWFVPPAHAEFRQQQKKTYFRLIPKFEEGSKYYTTDLKQAVDNEDWATISKFFEVYVTKYNKNDPTQVDATDSYVNNHFLRPMTVFAGTFAERGVSVKQTALLNQEKAFEDAMFLLEGTVKEQPGEGFFAAKIQIPEGPLRKQQAQEAWAKGKDAIKEYITIANNGLMMELNKIKQI